MFSIRERSSGSWLDPEAAGFVGWILGKRLWERVHGQVGVFITLTYRRDEYKDALELYRRQSERQDVALFVRRLGRALGQDLRGRWLCKMEFQQGGWVHFHIVLLGVRFVEHAILERTWRHGHTWVSRLNKRTCFYLTKYVAKGSRLPAWIYLERPRSVKFVRVSKGFWGESAKRQVTRDEYDEWNHVQRVDAYRPVGESLGKAGVLIRAANGKVWYRRASASTTLVELVRAGVECLGRNGRWLLFPGSVELAFAAASCSDSRSGPKRSDRGGTRPRSGLHLRGNRNPDAWPWYVDLCFRELWSDDVVEEERS